MIDPLPPGRLPLPSTTPTQEAVGRVPAFLPWAMPQRQPSPPPTSAPSALALPESSAPPAALPSLPPSLPMVEGLGDRPSMPPSQPGAATLPREAPPSPMAFGASLAPQAPRTQAPRTHAPPMQAPPAQAPPTQEGATIDACPPMPAATSVAPAVSSPIPATAPPIESIAVQVEAHLVDPRGGREIVIVPMRLRATGRLAQSADPRSWPPASDGAMASASLIPAPMPVPIVPRPSVAAAPMLAARTIAEEARALPPWLSALRPDDVGAEEDPSSRSPTTAADTANWLMRRLALVQQAGRAPTLWLRDYRLDPDEAFRVAADLHRLARDRGVALDRIVINGREHRPDPGAPARAESQE